MPNIRDIMQDPDYTFTDVHTDHLHLSGDVYARSIGSNLMSVSSQSGESLLPRLRFSDAGFTDFIQIVPGPLLTDQIVQPDDSLDYVQADIGGGLYQRDIFSDPTTTARFVKKYTFKGGSVQPTTDITVSFYSGSSAGDIIPDNKFFEFKVTPAQWPGDGQELSVDTTGKLGFDLGSQFIVRVSGASSWSQRFNAANTLPWQKEDHQLTKQYELPFANVPFATYDIAGGSVFSVTADTEVDLDIFTVKDEFGFTLNEATGEYTFAGSPGNYDGTFYTSMLGSTNNMALIFRLYINGVPVGDGFDYEVDSAGYRSATIPTDAPLTAGDVVKVTVECDKTASITFGFGQKKIRAYSKGAPA